MNSGIPADSMYPGEVVSHAQMCLVEGISLQHGMNFRVRGGKSVLLMSRRPGAPYSDRVEDEGRTLIYEGHDIPRTAGSPDPKSVDQPEVLPSGKPTRNGQFFRAAKRTADLGATPEIVRVYEKIKSGIWVFCGEFDLVNAWREPAGGRHVFKFKLEIRASLTSGGPSSSVGEHARLIPSHVRQAVWKRDKGLCVKCGCSDHLHFDHIIPYSKGGSSTNPENIQLLCARHNLQKSDRIE